MINMDNDLRPESSQLQSVNDKLYSLYFNKFSNLQLHKHNLLILLNKF